MPELRISEKISEFGNRKCCLIYRHFFVIEQINIDTWLYVPLTGHITI